MKSMWVAVLLIAGLTHQVHAGPWQQVFRGTWLETTPTHISDRIVDVWVLRIYDEQQPVELASGTVTYRRTLHHERHACGQGWMGWDSYLLYTDTAGKVLLHDGRKRDPFERFEISPDSDGWLIHQAACALLKSEASRIGP